MNRALIAWAAVGLAIMPSVLHAGSVPAPPPNVVGNWINPRGTVKVQTGDCAGKLCGWVIWAAPQALADARDSGVTRLVGTELLRNYRRTASGRYQGQVYVPDMGHAFYSTIEQQGANNLKISGCILGGLICKSQIWRRA
jgi:uncharacterized protein (DUF2147 family)